MLASTSLPNHQGLPNYMWVTDKNQWFRECRQHIHFDGRSSSINLCCVCNWKMKNVKIWHWIGVSLWSLHTYVTCIIYVLYYWSSWINSYLLSFLESVYGQTVRKMSVLMLIFVTFIFVSLQCWVSINYELSKHICKIMPHDNGFSRSIL